jgi:uncharacterized damage-inducible protein DinB
MSNIATLISNLPFARNKTLDTVKKIAALPDPQAALAWRPGPGRAHLAWQLMHIAITEEIFATERLWPEESRDFEPLWSRFRGGSTPDDNIPTLNEITNILEQTRSKLLKTLSRFSDNDLTMIPPAMAARGLTLAEVIQLIAWHEAHHQGQSHITLNLFRAAHGIAS